MTPPEVTRYGVNLEALDEGACRELLAGHPHQLGRLAFADGERLLVLPLTYRLHRGEIVFRTERDSVMDAAADGVRVAFQVDAVDPTWQEGWSVLVDGVLRDVDDETRRRELEDLPLRSWAPGTRDRFCRIEDAAIAGRRIV